DGGVEQCHLVFGAVTGEFDGGVGTDGGVDGDDRAGGGGGQQFAHHAADLGVVDHAAPDDVGGAGQLGERVGGGGADLHQAPDRLGRQVEDGEAAGPGRQPDGHGGADVAQPDVAQ